MPRGYPKNKFADMYNVKHLTTSEARALARIKEKPDWYCVMQDKNTGTQVSEWVSTLKEATDKALEHEKSRREEGFCCGNLLIVKVVRRVFVYNSTDVQDV